MKKMRWLLAALALFALVGAACGDDDDSTVSSPDTTAKDSGSTKPPEYTIKTSESGDTYKFDVPSGIKGGVVKLTLDNSAGKEPHDFQLVKLESGHTLDELVKEISDESAPLSPWLKHGTGVGETNPGATNSAIVKLEPDTEYVYVCTETNDEKHIAHADHGMNGTFTSGADSGAALPDANATVDTSEYKFAVDGLEAGKNTIAFTNKGSMLHHVIIIPFRDGKTLDDLKTFFQSEDQNAEPPVDFEKGTFSAVAGSGDTIVYDADLPAGHYAILCFMNDPGTAGPPHFAKGMVDELTIK